MKKFFKNAFVLSVIPLISLGTLIACSGTSNDDPNLPIDGPINPIRISKGFELSTLTLKNTQKPQAISIVEHSQNSTMDITASVVAIGFDKVGITGYEIGAIRYFQDDQYQNSFAIYADGKKYDEKDSQSWYLKTPDDTKEVLAQNALGKTRYQKSKGSKTSYPAYGGDATFVIVNQLDDNFKKYAKKNNVEVKTIVNAKEEKNYYLLEADNAFWTLKYHVPISASYQKVSTLLISQEKPSGINLIGKNKENPQKVDLSNYWAGMLFKSPNNETVALLKINDNNYSGRANNLYPNTYKDTKQDAKDVILSEADTDKINVIKPKDDDTVQSAFAILLADNAPAISGVVFTNITLNNKVYKVYDLASSGYNVEFLIPN